MQAKMAIILSDAHGTKCKIVLIEEIMLLNKELRTKNEEIAMLRKRIFL